MFYQEEKKKKKDKAIESKGKLLVWKILYFFFFLLGWCEACFTRLGRYTSNDSWKVKKNFPSQGEFFLSEDLEEVGPIRIILKLDALKCFALNMSCFALIALDTAPCLLETENLLGEKKKIKQKKAIEIFSKAGV